jgi:photosystem II stability/assembly factor-like uncharacterized protein
VSVAAAAPGQDKLIVLTGAAGASYETVTAWSSTDGGSTWVQLGQASGSVALTVNPVGIRFDPKNANVFWIFGYYGGPNGGLYKTTDGGNTFASVRPTGMSPNETEDVAIDSGSNTVLVTEHERAQSLYKSTDGGQTWSSIGASLPAGTANSQYPYIIDSNTYLMGCSFAIDGTWDTGGGTPGIYRTTDGGTTWAQVGTYEVFGSPVQVNRALYWSYYANGNGGILTSTDGGASWSVLAAAPQLYYSVNPVALASGQIASVTASNQVLVFSPPATTPTMLQGTIGVGNVFGLTYDASRNSLFSWQLGGRIERLDLH